MRSIYLIRHGQTTANEEHRYCGSTDLPLSPTGAAALHRRTPPEASFFTSGMRRTDETLERLFGAVPFEPLPAFREIDFGAFELHTYEELKDDPAYQAWITGDNERNIPPRGESGEAMTRRVLTAFAELQKREGDLVLVTHGGVIAAIMADLFPQEQKSRYEWQPKPGGGYVLTESGYRRITNE